MRFCFCAAAVLSLLISPAFAATDDEVFARKIALDLAGASSNDGFKIRDVNWTGTIRVKDPKLVQVNLYAGNQYWFFVGATEGAIKLNVRIYDESGKPVSSDPYEDPARAGAGFSPSASGPYYLRVEETEGDPATFCLIYSYK
jgi:hypothetical protein